MPRQDTIIRVLAGERFGPFGLARKLGVLALLESATFQAGRARYSLLMAREALRISETTHGIRMLIDGRPTGFPHPARDILDALRYFADQHSPLEGETLGEIPFPTGGIGFLTYEFAQRCDTIRFRSQSDPLGLPLASFVLGHIFVVFDHYSDLLYLIGVNYHEHEIDLRQAIDEIERRINDFDFNYLQVDERVYQPEWVVADSDRDSKAQYMDMVAQLRTEIVAGNLLQAVPSRRVIARTDIDALEAYRRLRRTNPSPYLFYLDHGDWQLFGASPEMHIKVRNNRLYIRPIAGTRRRGATRSEDVALEHELLADAKERAEHIMLVDLARNDLGRVCVPGTVQVVEWMSIERYSRVMHIVSEVCGELTADFNGADAIRATFPAGTVSGAPKIRAIETVDALEAYPRSFYAGLVGYIEPGGDLDTCITIRSALKKDGLLVAQAGGGVVYDSSPEREYEETAEKLAALLAAIAGSVHQMGMGERQQ